VSGFDLLEGVGVVVSGFERSDILLARYHLWL
jgi:hypothetical protein